MPASGRPPARMDAALSPSTPDDQSRTWDGRVLDTKEKLLEFLAEVEESRATGRRLDPDDNQPEPALDVERILATLDRHQVEYLAVGGTAAKHLRRHPRHLRLRLHP